MTTLNPKQWFKDVETVYNQRFNYLLSLASKHIYNRDYAIDAVQSAFAKTVEYFNKHPERKVRLQILVWHTLKECKKYNKYSLEIPVGDSRYFNEENNDE